MTTLKHLLRMCFSTRVPPLCPPEKLEGEDHPVEINTLYVLLSKEPRQGADDGAGSTCVHLDNCPLYLTELFGTLESVEGLQLLRKTRRVNISS